MTDFFNKPPEEKLKLAIASGDPRAVLEVYRETWKARPIKENLMTLTLLLTAASEDERLAAATRSACQTASLMLTERLR